MRYGIRSLTFLSCLMNIWHVCRKQKWNYRHCFSSLQYTNGLIPKLPTIAWTKLIIVTLKLLWIQALAQINIARSNFAQTQTMRCYKLSVVFWAVSFVNVSRINNVFWPLGKVTFHRKGPTFRSGALGWRSWIKTKMVSSFGAAFEKKWRP